MDSPIDSEHPSQSPNPPGHVHRLNIGSVSRSTRFVILSAINSPDQVIDLFDWADWFVETKILIVHYNVSAIDFNFAEISLNGVQLATLFEKLDVNLQDITTVEFISSLENSESLKLPLAFVSDAAIGALICLESADGDSSRNPEPQDDSFLYRVVIPGYLSHPSFEAISVIKLTNEYYDLPLEIPLMSFILNPENETVVKNRDEVTFEGCAFAGCGKKILSVEYSIDEGHTWTKTFLDDSIDGDGQKLKNFQLTKFFFTLELRQLPRNTFVTIRATDQNWVSQPYKMTAQSGCPYDNSCFTLLLKGLPNNQRALLYPSSVEKAEQIIDGDKFSAPTGPFAQSKQSLKSHFIENVLPIKSKGLRATNGLTEAVNRTVGGYKKRDLPEDTFRESSCQVNTKKDLKRQEKWRKNMERHMEIELRPVDERKLKPFVSQFIPMEKPGAKSTTKVYTRDEVRQHNTPEDCWIIIREHVYDVTPLVQTHPIGELANQLAAFFNMRIG